MIQCYLHIYLDPPNPLQVSAVFFHPLAILSKKYKIILTTDFSRMAKPMEQKHHGMQSWTQLYGLKLKEVLVFLERQKQSVKYDCNVLSHQTFSKPLDS